MPRRKAPPRLYLDSKRQQWIIRDGSKFVRTGLDRGRVAEAETALASYIGVKHTPSPSNDPLIEEVLAAYVHEHAPHIARPSDVQYHVRSLLARWQGKRVSMVTAKACRSYTASKVNGGARRDLQVLRAAVRHWHREHGPLSSIPAFVLPPRGEPRERWLTRSEAARLLWAARRSERLKRFILIGIYTGSRAGVITSLQWDWIDFERGIMRRRERGEADKSTKRRPAVRLGARILAHMKRWKAKEPNGSARVVSYQGGSIKRIRNPWIDACKKAGLVGVTPHTLRHTRATWVMQAGVSIWEAAGHLGMTVKTLETVYGHHHPDWQKGPADV